MKREKKKLSISTKTFTFFFISLLAIVFVVLFTYLQFMKVKKNDKYFVQVYLPSLTKLSELRLLVTKSNQLFIKWALFDRDTTSISYKEWNKLKELTYYQFKHDMWEVIDNWSLNEQDLYYKTIQNVDSLFAKQKTYFTVFEDPRTFTNYNALFKLYSALIEGGTINTYSKNINKQIDYLQESINNNLQKFLLRSYTYTTNYQQAIIIIAFILVIFLIIIAYILIRGISNDSKFIINELQELVKGQTPIYKVAKLNSYEFHQINQLLNTISASIKRAAEFALQLSQNNFNQDFKPLSREDLLGNTLLRLRDNLIRAQKEAELRHIENMQRQWSSQGIAEFADLLRDVSDDLDELSKKVIAKLVDYTVANIGGIYIVNDENPNNLIIELRAFYAFDRHKFLKREFKPGETLIGQCYLEGKTIYMNDIPKDYFIQILSGLGKDRPRSLLIVPLKVNEQILGIVELASFKEFEKYQIEFVEKIGESIASAISAVKINLRTKKILEETEEKTRRLEHQENIARKNIAKIKAQLNEVQKTLDKERAKLQKVIAERNNLENELKNIKITCERDIKEKQAIIDHLRMAINNTMGYYQLSANGDFIDANALYLKHLNTTKEQILGTKHQLFISREFINSGNYKKIWDDLKVGKTVNTTVQYLIEGKTKLVSEVYTPILNDENELVSVIVLSYIS